MLKNRRGSGANQLKFEGMDEISVEELETIKERFQIKKTNSSFLRRQKCIYEKFHKKFRLNDIKF